MLKREIKLTKDGSHTLYVPALNETYHSIHGAVQEAQHVYIKKGFLNLTHSQNIDILEIGFGTGLNCLLTWMECEKNNSKCHYTSIEKYPLSGQEVHGLNYQFILQEDKKYNAIHSAPWGEALKLSNNFSLLKREMDLTKDDLQGKFDVIYFDAFAPDKQPEMWTKEVFLKVKSCMKPSALLVTYCCKGSVKRTLVEVGFKIKKTDGPPGKREMLLAFL